MNRKIWIIALMTVAGIGIVFGLWAERGRSSDTDAGSRIAALQKAIAAEGLSWQAGETSMSRLSQEEQRRRLGLLIEPMEELTTEPEETIKVGALPATLDWRDHSGNWVTPIRDQGSCGSCWAFATTGVLESMVRIVKDVETEFDLSEQTLLSCSNAGDCDGGYVEKAADFVRRTGIPREGCFPYSASEEPCKPCSGWMSKTVKITSWKRYYNAKKTTLQEALQNGPIAAHMDVYSDFYNYRSGIYERTSSATYKGGHGIVIVGYNNTENYWICKNSWGTNWGESGFFRIRVGNSKIASWCWSLSGPRLDNQPPVLKSIPAQTVWEGKPLAFSLSASDSDYDTLTFSSNNLPEGAALDAATGDFTWTPNSNQAGVYSVRFGASDGINTVYKTASITVTNVKYKTW